MEELKRCPFCGGRVNVLEKILEEIKEEAVKMSTQKSPHQYYKAVGTRKIEEIIRSHMDEIPKCGECSRRKWIPVEERLPEEPEFIQDSYIVQQKSVINPFSAYWDGKEWTDLDDDKVEEVIAWQPLPERYKG